MKKFFSHDPNYNGFMFHGTAEEAKAEAERCMGVYRDEANDSDEWVKNVDEVCWGEVRQIPVEKEIPYLPYVDFTLTDTAE